MSAAMFGSITILGVRVNTLDRQQLLAFLTDAARTGHKTVVGHVNLRGLNLAFGKPWYRHFLNQADLVFADGFAVLWGAKLLGQPLKPEYRMTCPDFLEDLAVLCASKNLSLFLLAGKPGVVDQALAQLATLAPTLRAAGQHGYFTKQGTQNDTVIAQINAFRPDILYIGFGMPLQEQWIRDNLARIDACVFLPLGGCLDFYTNTQKRAPRWMTDHGYEWLGRLVFEPGRLWKQYVLGIPLYFYRVLLQRVGLLHFD